MTCIRRNLDTQNCCNQWQKGIRTIDGQYPDDNREFTIQAGTGVTITPVTAGIEISASLPSVPGPMIFRGTLGTGGTITTLPPATSTNIGDVYVAIESGTVPVTYETGDMVISNGITWVVVPSGDDPVDWSQIQNKPTTVAGYGITDAVDTGSVQNISASKIFTSGFITLKNNMNKGVNFTDNNDALKGHIICSNAGAVEIKSYVTASPITAVGQRSYNTSNTDDIVTIGTLKTATDVVHTSGNETINDVKTFTSNPMTLKDNPRYQCKNSNVTRGSLPATNVSVGGLYCTNNNNDGLLDIAETLDTSGKGRVDITVKDYNNTNAQTFRLSTDGYMTGPSRAYNASNTSDIVNIALLDAYTPMVRTTGNQNMSGIKLGNFYTYTGFIASMNDTVSYTALVDLGTDANYIMLSFSAVTRTAASIGVIATNGSGVGTFTGSQTGTGDITLGIGKDANDHYYLCAKRTSAAGQDVTFTIFGIAKGSQRIDAPAGGAGIKTITSYTEIVKV